MTAQPIEQEAWNAFQKDADQLTDHPADQPTTTAADTKPRTATQDKPEVADPDAPYGYMQDPKTGETRPRKRPGKQAKSAAAPPSRPANQARTRATSAATGTRPPKNYSGPLTETAQGIWLIMAGVPTPDKPVKFVGLNVQAATIRLKAQAAVLKENTGQIVGAVNMMAQHSKPVQNAVEKYTADTGPAWVLPAMMALVPFAVQSAAIWRAPVQGDLINLAKQTDDQFDELFKTMSTTQTPEASANGDQPTA